MQNLYLVLSNWATNSLLGLHPPTPKIFQIDANFGATAAVAEMLLQSHKGIIRILPALPFSWIEGEVTGLRARGGFEVSIAWEKGGPKKITILSLRGGECRLKLPSPMKVTVTCKGALLMEPGQAVDTLMWKTEPCSRYDIFSG